MTMRSRRSRKGLRVMVMGAGGMLGHKLAQIFPSRFDTVITFRSRPVFLDRNPAFDQCTVVHRVTADRLKTVEKAIDAVRPDVVVNCIGVIKQVTGSRSDAESVAINALFPHQLAGICSERSIRLIHVSTDCVFSGRKGMYSETDTADAYDLYGRSKLLGEVIRPGCLTLRTSIIGREIGTSYGLVEWFLSNAGRKANVYNKVIYSGFPTVVLAGIMADVIEKHPGLTGLMHVSSEPISKADLLNQLKTMMKLNIETVPVNVPEIDRSLDSSLFRKTTGFVPLPWPEMLSLMVSDAGSCGLYSR